MGQPQFPVREAILFVTNIISKKLLLPPEQAEL
jgi:hypothetical protein